jgi:(p)ppGpp synthase/HD superfamily hydrolase
MMIRGLETGLLHRAFVLAVRAHGAQTRHGGDTYISHPLTVAAILVQHGITDEEILAAAILHDVLEDTDVGEATLRFETSSSNAIDLVKEVTKDENHKFPDLKSWEGAMIKMADRIHNLRTWAKQDKLARYIEKTDELIREHETLFQQAHIGLYNTLLAAKRSAEARQKELMKTRPMIEQIAAATRATATPADTARAALDALVSSAKDRALADLTEDED